MPHATYFSDDDMKVLFEGALANGQWGINQILNAGGIDEVFCQTYKDSKNNALNHSQIWKEFWEAITNKGHSYEELKKLMVEDGLVDLVLAEEEVATQDDF